MKRKLLGISLSLLLLAVLSMPVGCLSSRVVVVGTDPCPMPSELAMEWWSELPMVIDEELGGIHSGTIEWIAPSRGEAEFNIWIGRIVNYCEAQESRLEDG